jgi:hypothetical protein
MEDTWGVHRDAEVERQCTSFRAIVVIERVRGTRRRVAGADGIYSLQTIETNSILHHLVARYI